MKVKDIIKKQTTIVVIAVLLVTITVIGVSYAIFFDVKSNKNNQVITAGTLRLTLSANELTLSEPVTQAVGLASSPISYTIENTGNLPAAYSIYLYGAAGNTIPLSKLKISTDGTTAKTLTAITSETVDGKTMYKIDTGNITAGSPDLTKKVRIWADEEAYSDEASGEVVKLAMYIVSEVKE